MTPEDLGMPNHAMAGGGSGSISISLLYALTEQRIRQNDVIVNVYGSYDPGVIDTIQVTDVEAAFRLFFSVSRELSRIDGAFIIDDDGVIESAGTYLRVDADIPALPSGLGARHTGAAWSSSETRPPPTAATSAATA